MTSDVCDWPLEFLKDYTSICEDNEYVNDFTFQVPQQEPLPQANTINEGDPFEGQIFNNDDEAYEFYSVFARKNGFSIRRDHIYKSRKNESEDNPLGVYKREFVCHRADIVKQRKVDDVESQRKRKSSRCSCSAKMLVTKRTIGFEEQWVVTHFSNDHNHELLDDKELFRESHNESAGVRERNKYRKPTFFGERY
ncbi:hypothetical protein TSUD_100730 [Trifolium subterraneum]|uniref:FAR1 domain-containing protein n=1 Tax=Trifolium subterraneum TaxID=3900 RepID=A0A2Z6NL66_TRISU|nr:hypothetical protein TSUD_100730 [Trifolium subterraneum]